MNEKKEIDLQCAWNDYGYRCSAAGSMSDSTNGSGPWYCSEHYWHGLRGYPKAEKPPAPRMSYRERWYAEQGLPYEPPKSGGLRKILDPRKGSA